MKLLLRAKREMKWGENAREQPNGLHVSGSDREGGITRSSFGSCSHPPAAASAAARWIISASQRILDGGRAAPRLRSSKPLRARPTPQPNAGRGLGAARGRMFARAPKGPPRRSHICEEASVISLPAPPFGKADLIGQICGPR